MSTREKIEEREQKCLASKATPSTNLKYTARQHPYEPDDIRPSFQRDYTRIIHSRAFRRLRHKTQVFISPRNDHLCTRMEHCIYVASVSQTIARALSLNEDLVSAIAIGHDVGHAPFGHKGEKVLNELANKHDLKFEHELHSLRVVDFVDRLYDSHNGLNLTFAVRDGIVCHCGERFEKELSPDREKTPEDDLSKTIRGKSRPATLEGCVVRWADKVAYLGRDLEDAISVDDFISKNDVPKIVQKKLGTSNKEIINTLVTELCQYSSVEDDKIAVSEPVHEALNTLREFSYKNIYQNSQVTKHFVQIDRAMHAMFDFLLERLDGCQDDLDKLSSNGNCCSEKQSFNAMLVFADFLKKDIRNWQPEDNAQLVIDFMAGMTDSFFNEAFSQFFLPASTV